MLRNCVIIHLRTETGGGYQQKTLAFDPRPGCWLISMTMCGCAVLLCAFVFTLVRQRIWNLLLITCATAVTKFLHDRWWMKSHKADSAALRLTLWKQFTKNEWIVDWSSSIKSWSTQRTDTENTVDKSSTIPRTNLSNKSTRIENPSEIDIHRDNLILSVLSGHGENLSSVTPDTLRITCKNKRKKTSDTSISIK